MINAPVTKVETTVKATISNQSSGATADITNSQTIIACTVQNGVRGAKGDSGEDGHSPVLSWSGDQISIDGVVSGPHLTGPQGIQGLSGVDGADGAKGDKGDTGAQGPQGIQGIQGTAGADGPQGVPGVDGEDGKDGDQRVFVQSSQPNFNGLTGVWLQTGMANDGFTIWFEDGE